MWALAHSAASLSSAPAASSSSLAPAVRRCAPAVAAAAPLALAGARVGGPPARLAPTSCPARAAGSRAGAGAHGKRSESIPSTLSVTGAVSARGGGAAGAAGGATGAAGLVGAGGFGHPSRPLKPLIQPLKPFVDDRFPRPEPRVSAFLLTNAIDLQRLRKELSGMGCPTSMWQGQVLLCGSSEALRQQQCSSVFLPDGCVVCWHMNIATERLVLELAASCPKERRRPTANFGDAGTWTSAATQARESLGLAAPVATERLDVADAPEGVISAVDPQDGLVRLTRDVFARTSHQLGLSLGLAVAVRLDALERQIEARLESNWRDMHAASLPSVNLSKVSHKIFATEKGLHDLRYELNSEAGLLDAPDLLWEHALAERLYDQVVAHFDVRRRTALLNDRLSHSLDYLQMLSEHVRHQYSVRLERIIILLIFLELCLGLWSHGRDILQPLPRLLASEGESEDGGGD